MGEGGEGNKETEYTVVPNVILSNISFQWMQTVLLNVFARKESNTPEYCTLINNELLYATRHFSSVSQNRVTSLHKKQVHTCNNSLAADASTVSLLTEWDLDAYGQTSCMLTATYIEQNAISHQFLCKAIQASEVTTRPPGQDIFEPPSSQPALSLSAEENPHQLQNH